MLKFLNKIHKHADSSDIHVNVQCVIDEEHKFGKDIVIADDEILKDLFARVELRVCVLAQCDMRPMPASVTVEIPELHDE